MQKKKQTSPTKQIILYVLLAIIVLLLVFAEDIIKLTTKNKIALQENNPNEAIAVEANAPVVSAGMIPVKWNGENWEITNKEDEDWYDYKNGKLAYVMLNDGYYRSEIERGVEQDQLMQNNVGVGVPDDLQIRGSIYMWIPRFAYNEENEIKYINQGYSLAREWTVPEMFMYETKTRDFSLAGIWLECCPLENASEVNIKVNNMTGENNKYGFIANTIATNAANETTYMKTLENYINNSNVGASIARPLLTDITNSNRTIVKIINTNKLEPIKAKAYYDETTEKIKIEVIYNTNSISKIIDSKGNILSENSIIADTGDEIIGNKIYKFLVIDNLGNQKEIELEVSGLDIYIIENEEDLKFFRDAVNAGKTTRNTKAYQIADVTMNEGKYIIDEDTGDITFSEDAEQWEPIDGYQGNYYGKGYSISGIYINTNNDYQGLFGTYKGVGNEIEGVKIKKSKIITTGQYVGGIVGNVNSVGFTMKDCCNEGQIQGNKYVGGLIGGINNSNTSNNFIISNCRNKGNVNGNSTIGGIGGHIQIYANTNILKCCNTGDINASNTGTGNRTGGLFGELSISANNNKTTTCNMLQCYNKGNVNSNGDVYTGGLVGLLKPSSNGRWNC